MIKTTVVRTRQRATQLSIELSRNPDDSALAVQAASANQAASKLEQLMVECGRAYRAYSGGRAARDADSAGGRAWLGSASFGSSLEAKASNDRERR
jgi:hypothetical protein